MTTRTPDPEALLTAAVGREAFRPAFEAWWGGNARRLNLPCSDKFRRCHYNPASYAENGLNAAFEGYCAAMESITSDAAIERAAKHEHERAESWIRENGGGYPTWEMLPAEDHTKDMEDVRRIILAAITPSLAEGA